MARGIIFHFFRKKGGSGILEIDEKLSNGLIQSPNHLYIILFAFTITFTKSYNLKVKNRILAVEAELYYIY